MMSGSESLRKLALMGGIDRTVKLTSTELAGKIGASAQTAARRLQTLEQGGLISRSMAADGQLVTITKKGVESLREEYKEYQQIFAVGPGNKVQLVGKVFTGLGEGQYYITQDGYMKQFEGRLNMTPFPGTLNIRLNGQSIGLRRKMENVGGIKIDGFEADDRTFGGGNAFKSKIDGTKCAVIIPERTHYPADVLEVLSNVNLRKRLKLSDGDEVMVEVSF